MRPILVLLATVILGGCAVHTHDRQAYHYPSHSQVRPMVIRSAPPPPIRYIAPAPRPATVIYQPPRKAPLPVRPGPSAVYVTPKPPPRPAVQKVRPASRLAAPKPQPPRQATPPARNAQRPAPPVRPAPQHFTQKPRPQHQANPARPATRPLGAAQPRSATPVARQSAAPRGQHHKQQRDTRRN